MNVRVVGYTKPRDPLVDAECLFRSVWQIEHLPRIGEWIECIDANQDEDGDIYVVKAVLHIAREFPRPKNINAPSMDNIEPWIELVLEAR